MRQPRSFVPSTQQSGDTQIGVWPNGAPKYFCRFHNREIRHLSFVCILRNSRPAQQTALRKLFVKPLLKRCRNLLPISCVTTLNVVSVFPCLVRLPRKMPLL